MKKTMNLTKRKSDTGAQMITVEHIVENVVDVDVQLKIDVRSEVTSTNIILKKMAEEGTEEGYVLVANKQTMGKGRSGRSFHSPAGNGIYFSVLLRPKCEPKDALLITTAAAVATVKGIEFVMGKQTGIKWVNDLFYEGKKVCGILTEASIDTATGGLAYAVLGVGINLTDGEEGFPKELENIAGSLYGKEACDDSTKARLVAAILTEFFEYYKELTERKFMADYKRYSIVVGKQVEAYTETSSEFVTVVDIDENGALLVKDGEGQVKELTTGEIRIRPRDCISD